jgi:hypothetical protein
MLDKLALLSLIFGGCPTRSTQAVKNEQTTDTVTLPVMKAEPERCIDDRLGSLGDMNVINVFGRSLRL